EVYYDIGDKAAYEANLNEVLAMNVEFDNPEWEGEILLLQGRLGLMHFDFVSADRALSEALRIAHSIHYGHLIINVMTEIGRMQRLRGQLHSAVLTLQQVVGSEELALEGVAGLAAYIELTKTHLSLNDTDAAYAVLQQSQQVIGRYPNEHQQYRQQIFELFARCLEQKQQYEQAYGYLQRATLLKDVINNQQIKQTIAIRAQQQQREDERLRRASAERENSLLKQSQHQMEIINKVAIELASTLDMKVLGKQLYQLMNYYFDAHFCSLCVNHPELRMVEVRSMIDEGQPLPLLCLPYGTPESRTLQVIEDRKPLVLNGGASFLRVDVKQKKPNSLLFLPLIQEQTVLGVLSIQSVLENRFDGDDLNLILAIAPFISLALSNALSHEQVQLLNAELVLEKEYIEQAQQQIQFLANHDTLTELPNRRALEAHLNAKLAESTTPQFSLVYIDLDGFKPVNDAHGHLIGDRVLQIVGGRLRNVLRKSDFAARIGGDEFVLVVASVVDQTQISVLIERILQSIEQPISVDGNVVQISASIGVVECSEQAQTLDDLMHYADQAMYDVKRAGKGGIKFHPRPHS
ncbi:MAG: diguanylate cyclase, partial [Reinekea sp.]|nr:diguanylate cyclase [Reinekea sp.]